MTAEQPTPIAGGRSRRGGARGRVQDGGADDGRGRIWLGLVVPVTFVIVWQVASTFSGPLREVTSSPWAALRVLGDDARSGVLVSDLKTSLAEAIGGWLLACLIASPLGVVMARSRTLSQLLLPAIEVVRPISPVAWIPLTILWLGVGYEEKLVVIFIICFFIVFVNVYDGARLIDPLLVKAARTLTASRLRIAIHVLMPAATRGILVGAQYALTGAWGGMVVTELVGASSGIGYRMRFYGSALRPDGVVAGMVVVAIVGWLLDRIAKLLFERFLSKYR